MKYEEARQTILYHAGLTAPNEGNEQSLSDALFWTMGTGVLPDIQHAAQALVDSLDEVNRHLNGAATDGMDGPLQPDEEVTYAVASILEKGLEFLAVESRGVRRDPRDVNWFHQSMWRISAAWEAVLAGNIQSISTYVEQEARARGVVGIRQVMVERRRMARVP